MKFDRNGNRLHRVTVRMFGRNGKDIETDYEVDHVTWLRAERELLRGHVPLSFVPISRVLDSEPAGGFVPEVSAQQEIDEMASQILFERIRAGTDRPDYLVVSHDYGRAIAEECYSIAREMHKRSVKGLAGVSKVEIKE